MMQFLTDNKRAIAVAIASTLALFASKLPLLSEVTPERIEWVLGLVAVWVAQSGAKAIVQAHADGKVAVVQAQLQSPSEALAAAPKP